METISTLNLSRDEWLEKRKLGIGGSDVAGILGFSKWKTPLDVYLDKLGLVPPIEDNDAMYFGRELEPVIAKRFEEETGFKVVNDNKIRFHKDHKCLIANIDRLIQSHDDEGPGVLEIKTANGYAVRQWEGDAIPLDYYAQLQHYLNVLDYKYGYVALLIDGREYRHIRFERDQPFINSMTDALLEFWNDNVKAKVTPDPVNAADLENLYPESHKDKSIEVDVEATKAHAELLELKQQKKTLEEKISEKEFVLKSRFQDAESVQYAGQTLATWKTSKSNRFDTKKFKAAYPELHGQFLTESTSRRFLIK